MNSSPPVGFGGHSSRQRRSNAGPEHLPDYMNYPEPAYGPEPVPMFLQPGFHDQLRSPQTSFLHHGLPTEQAVHYSQAGNNRIYYSTFGELEQRLSALVERATRPAILYSEKSAQTSTAIAYSEKSTQTTSAVALPQSPIDIVEVPSAKPAKRGIGRPRKLRKVKPVPSIEPVKRGRGRPKGSGKTSAVHGPSAMPEKRKSGRPKGPPKPVPSVIPEKRGRGRPRGSSKRIHHDAEADYLN